MTVSKRVRAGLFAAYLLALLCSNAFRLTHDSAPRLAPDQYGVTIAGRGDRDVVVALRDRGPDDVAAPVVLLLHGSPAPGAPRSLIAPLARHFRVIAPDLPGFGNSTLRVPD